MHTVKKVTGSIMWANLLLLFFLSLIPFATGWVGENHFAHWPVFVYALNLLCAALAYTFLLLRITSVHGNDSPMALTAIVALIWFIPDKRMEKALQHPN